MSEKKKLFIALACVGALALVSLVAGIVIIKTRTPGEIGSADDKPVDESKWVITVSPEFRSTTTSASGARDAVIARMAATETRRAKGRPRVEGHTVHYRDWDTGTERVWTVSHGSEIDVEPDTRGAPKD